MQGNGHVAGFHLNQLKEKDIPFLRRKLGIVFQDFQLLADRNTRDNLVFVLKATGWKDAEASDTVRWKSFCSSMLRSGINLAPSPFEAAFWSAAHTRSDVDATLAAAAVALG